MGKNYCKIEKKWCKFLKKDICTYCFANISDVTRCPRLKEIETIRLIDILKKVNFEVVFACICKWYNNQEKSKEGYREVFNKLLQMTPKKHNLSDLFINVEKQKDEFSEENTEYLDTDGIDMSNGKRYGIEFMPWIDWISMFITKETLDSITNEEIVAACLYEMTFFGFEEEKVKNELDKMIESVEECKKQIKK